MLLTRRHSGLTLHDLADFNWLPFAEPVIRTEEYQKDDRYIVRAEIPGVDPTKDIEITAKDGVLRIVVTRQEEMKEGGRTEFRYGTFQRVLTMPAGTKEESIKATYTDGILEVTMTVGEPKEQGRHIPIAVGNDATTQIKKS